MNYTIIFHRRFWLKFVVFADDPFSALESVFCSQFRFFCDPPHWYDAKVLDESGKPVLLPYEEM